MKSRENIRVRFAPSPTGYLHIGGLRTALYNYLFAKKHKGVFVVRIEDTDRARYVEGAVENLLDILQRVGLEFQEGPTKKGPFGPYVQSERLSIYKEHAEGLLKQGKAYRCFCTPERLAQMRRDRAKAGLPPKYDRTCMKLSQEEIERNLANDLAYTIRMRIPENSIVRFRDLIRGEVEFHTDQLDDQVLLKSDGYPTYHLANVVDDHLMAITHVIRGEEWLSSTPKHVLLYEYSGWQLPQFAHLPLLLNPDRSKLSKRQGDVAVEDYLRKGYLPEALLNFVALLGWNPGTDQELFTLDELVEQFSLERVNKAGAIFNIEKLNWLNAQHLRRKSDGELLKLLKQHLEGTTYGGRGFDNDYLLKVIRSMRERVSFVHEFVSNAPYFFESPQAYDESVLKKHWKPRTPEFLRTLSDEFAALDHPTREEFEAALQRTAKALQVGSADLIHATRLAISGVGGGPGLYDILYILGRDESVRRIRTALERLNNKV